MEDLEHDRDLLISVLESNRKRLETLEKDFYFKEIPALESQALGTVTDRGTVAENAAGLDFTGSG